MPVNKNVLLRYGVLDRCLRNTHREYDAKDLLRECNNELENYGFSLIKLRTIYDDIAKLSEAPYYAPIEKLPGYANEHIYRYSDPNYVLPLVSLKKDEKVLLHKTIEMLKKHDALPQYQWMIALLTQIDNGCGIMDSQKRIVEFQNNPDLLGIEHFQTLLGAIIEKQTLKIVYKPYGKNDKVMTVYPYYLKQFNDRWFLISKVGEYDTISVLAIDRISSVELQHVDFIDTDIDFENYFEDVVGVTVMANRPVEKVKLRIRASRYPYIETKPIHWSQTELKGESCDGWKVVRLNLIINNELEAVILGLGNDVEVLEPYTFRIQIREKIKSLSQIYSFADTSQSE